MSGMRALTNKEFKQIVASLCGVNKVRDSAWIILQRYTGFRISEVLSLKRKDVCTSQVRGSLSSGVSQRKNAVDHKKNTGQKTVTDPSIFPEISVQRKNMKKKTQGRTVILHERAREALRLLVRWLDKRGFLRPSDYLFQSYRNINEAMRRDQAYKIINRAGRSCGLSGKIGTHSLRKTFALTMYKALNNDLIQTQRALGHVKVDSTAHYLEASQEIVNKAILSQR